MTVLLTEREIRRELERLCWCARRFFWSSAVDEAAKLSPLPVAAFEAAFDDLAAAMQAGDETRVEAALDALLTDPRETATSSPRRLPPAHSEAPEGGPRC